MSANAPVAPKSEYQMTMEKQVVQGESIIVHCAYVYVFCCLILLAELVYIAISYTTMYKDGYFGTENEVNLTPTMYTTSTFTYFKHCNDSLICLFVGLGFMFSYLRFHRWMSLAMVLFASMFAMQFYILYSSFWAKAFISNITSYLFAWNNPTNGGLNFSDFGTYIYNFEYFLRSIKCAFAVCISLGVVIGKIDAFQTFILAIIEPIFFALNEAFIFYGVEVKDRGGSIYIHTFGAFFGVTVSLIFCPSYDSSENRNNKPGYGSSAMAFLGTFFLWVFFPTFNAYNPMQTFITQEVSYAYNMQFLGITNTFWALTSSTILAFWSSMIFKDKRFNIEHILRATLAGGVMIGACAEMFVFPYPALLVGAAAGIISVLSFTFLDPVLEKCGIYDTVGCFHLFGIPGIFGCIASAIAVINVFSTWYGNMFNVLTTYFRINRAPYQQGGYQILAEVITIAVAIVGGIIVGLIFKLIKYWGIPEDTFGDHIFFHLSYRLPDEGELEHRLYYKKPDLPQPK